MLFYCSIAHTVSTPDDKKRKYVEIETPVVEKLTTYDPSKFYSPFQTTLPVVYEKEDEIQPFLAPGDWLKDAAKTVLEQADLEETNNPRVSPVALVRCSRGGKTRSMVELAKEVRKQDSSYGIVYMTFNTNTPLMETPVQDPMAELCVRIAFAAFKDRSEPSGKREFLEFSRAEKASPEWVEDWLGNEKCILFIDELNLLQDSIGTKVAFFLKQHFLIQSGRGVVFSSHVASFSNLLVDFMSSPNDRKVITRPLPIIPSLHEARVHFRMPDLSAQDALFLGLIPGLIVERKMHRAPTTRRINAVGKFLGTIQSREDVCRLLSSLLTGEGIDRSLEELMTTDLKHDGTLILRWIPLHMHYVLDRISRECPHVDAQMRHCLSSGIVDLFRQFASTKWEAGDAWEALFLIVLIVRCLTASFDDTVIPLRPFITGSIQVQYNSPLHGNVDFFRETNPVDFVDGIPLRSWAPLGTCALSIYYPGHARFEAYDVILAFWDADGSRLLYGYQLKEGSTIPAAFAFDKVFEKSFLIRGKATEGRRSVRLWHSVSDTELDSFFGVSATHWSAKQYRKLQE